MQAFHNDIKVKEKYIARVLAHKEADEIIKGTYWDNGKGCAVGCTIHSGNHKIYETELGIPEWLARLEDRIFEGLPNDEAKEWPLKFLEAVNLGSDLNKIKISMLIFIVESARENFNHEKYPKQLAAIDGVLFELRKDVLGMDNLRKARAADADAAADAADADAAAYAAAYAADADAAAYAAAYAADAAAYAADAAYDAAAAAAAYAYAADAARRNAFSKFAKKLLELIKECK